jgi:hypothetical protein
MASKLATLGGAALALLLVSSFPISAVARHGGGGGGFGGGGHIGGFGGGHFGGGPRMGGPGIGRAHVGAPFGFAPRAAHFANRRVFHDRRIHRNVFFRDRRFHHRRFHRNAFFVAPVFGAYAYSDYSYGYGCYWLRRNALYTGSPYWWNRYYACLNGY